MHEWIKRAVSGYWTHAGYMNWDSGLGFDRWHQAKKLGLTQEALVGLASSDSLLPGKQWGPWAKSMLDSGFDFYDARGCPRARRRPRPACSSTSTVPQGDGSARLALARIRPTPPARSTPAGQEGRGEPPPLYSYDPDIGRLAVTTPDLQHRDRRRQPEAPSPTAASISRGCSTASRRSPRTSAAARRPRSACWSATSAGRRVTASQLGRSRVEPRRATAAADQGAAGRGSRVLRRRRPRLRRAVQRPARDRHRPPAELRCASRIASHATGSRRAGPRPGAVRQRALHRRRAVPELARPRRAGVTSRSCATARA